MIATDSSDFICKIFAKHYLTTLRLVSNTINRSNKHSSNSNVLLVTIALNVKSRIFYNNHGCNTKKMPFSKICAKNLDLSNFIIGAHCHMTRNLILYLIPDGLLTFFSQDKKKISVKIIFISRFLVKIKKVHFSLFTFSRLLMMAFSFLQILNFNNFVVDKSCKNWMFKWRWVIAALQASYVMYVQLKYMLRNFTKTINLSRYLI